MKPNFKNIALYFGMARQTISIYKREKPEHYQALKDRFIKMNKPKDNQK